MIIEYLVFQPDFKDFKDSNTNTGNCAKNCLVQYKLQIVSEKRKKR